MSTRLKDRIALVTGGSRGIGRALAVGLAKEGSRIAVTARSEKDLASAVEEIQSLGGRAVAIPAELGEVGMPVAKVLREFGTIDILVNDAALGSSGNPRPLSTFDDSFWNLTLQVNLTVPYLLCKAVLPVLQEKRSGRILNIASLAGRVGLMHGVAYAASKHGLLGLTRHWLSK